MHDLPQNELFSAYLDGELSAAEQAEMEQLLAASPAARQLLDELHALSNTLQSLPHEKLHEDLSQHVLRVAERRMLTDAPPSPAAAAPVPLAQSIFQRVATRRTLVWLSLTAAIALVIVINDRRQGVGPGVQVARREVEAPAAANKQVLREPGPPPTIQAAHDSESKPSKAAKTAVAANRAAKAPAAAMAPAAKPPAVTVPTTARAPTLAAAANSGAKSDAGGTKPGLAAGKAEQSEKSGVARAPALVVRCDITPQAAQRRPLEKILDANGMTWRKPDDKHRAAPEIGDRSQALAKSPPAVQASPALPKGAAPHVMRRLTTVHAPEQIYEVEGTAAQVEATLASLAAQPDVFLSFSVNRPQTTATSGRVEFEQRPHVSGPQAGRGTVGQLDVDVRQRTQAQSAPSGSPRTAMPLDEKRLADDLSRQRVVFVLHVVGGVHPPAAAPAPGETGAAKPAEPPAAPHK